MPGRESVAEAQELQRKVREARRERGWSQPELARKARVSLQALRKLEQGGSREPSFYVVRRIAEALNLDLIRVARPKAVAPGDPLPKPKPKPRPRRSAVPGKPRLVYLTFTPDFRGRFVTGAQVSMVGRVEGQSGGTVSVEPESFGVVDLGESG